VQLFGCLNESCYFSLDSVLQFVLHCVYNEPHQRKVTSQRIHMQVRLSSWMWCAIGSLLTTVLQGCGGGGGGSSAAAGTITCTSPQVLSADGKSCVTPTVAIVSATDAVGVSQGALANGGATNDTQPALNGVLSSALTTGQSLVVLQDGVLLGTVTPPPSGTAWRYPLPAALANAATYRFTAKVLDGTGTLVDKVSDPFDVTVVTTAPYTKVSNDGKALLPAATLGSAATDWACTLAYNATTDTYLLWEVKTTDGGLRDWAKPYSNYDDTTVAQVPTFNGVGYTYANPSQADIDASTNSVGFKNAVNVAGLCGKKDWRLPSATTELEALIDPNVIGGTGTAVINATWFPNTQPLPYWTSYAVGVNPYAYFVNFKLGNTRSNMRSSSDSFYGNRQVRLVRSN
jgi:Protein of unknown function (DUF1566)